MMVFSNKFAKEIGIAASQTKLLLMLYASTTEEKVEEYVVEPYSYRKQGTVFFAFDTSAKQIKAFKVEGIKEAKMLEKTYEPRWPVEIRK